MRARVVAGLVPALLLVTGLAAADVRAPSATVHPAHVRADAGALTSVPVRIEFGAARRQVDIAVLLDTSNSMASQLGPVTRELSAAVSSLQRQGVDLRVGLALAGSSPDPQQTDNGDSAVEPAESRHDDPDVDPSQPGYRPPQLFRRVLPIGAPSLFGPAVRTVHPEVLAFASSANPHVVWFRRQAQLLGIDQLLHGTGFTGSLADTLHDRVAPGQVAGFRSDPRVQRFLVDVTDDVFANPAGTPAGGVGAVGRDLAAARVRHIGLVSQGYDAAVRQLGQLSTASGAFAPARGVRCAGPDGNDLLPAGVPFVCTTSKARMAVETAVLSATRPVVVEARASAVDPVFEGLTGQTSLQVDAFHPHTLTAQVQVRCPLANTGSTHTIPVTAVYGGTAVATAPVTVECQPGLTPPVGTAPTASAAVVVEAQPPPPVTSAGTGQPAQAGQLVPQPQPQGASQAQQQPQSQTQAAAQPRVAVVEEQLPAEEQVEVRASRREPSGALPIAGWVGVCAATMVVVVRRRRSDEDIEEPVRG